MRTAQSVDIARKREEALESYKRGKLQDALKQYKELATLGELDCQAFLGWMYLFGVGTGREPAEAVRWLTPVAETGDRRAQYDLGLAHLVAGDIDQAVNWLSRSAAAGFGAASARLGSIYESGHLVDTDPSLAFQHYRDAYRQGHLVGYRGYSALLLAGKEGWVGRLRGLMLRVWGQCVAIYIGVKNPFDSRMYY